MVTCQGTSQLLFALATMDHRSKTTSPLSRKSQDYLIIYGLYSKDEYHLAGVIKKLACELWDWKEVVFLSGALLRAEEEAIYNTGLASSIRRLHEWLGTDRADEVFLARDWQFENQWLIHAYKDATKICYGDGMGFFFCKSEHAPNARSIPFIPKRLRERLKSLGILKSPKSPFGTIPFDYGYFLLPSMSCRPPMRHERVDPRLVLDRIHRASQILEEEKRDPLDAGHASSVVLLTSNFSPWRMSEKNEIKAYRYFLETQQCDRNSILLIKPHPRDDPTKNHRVKRALESQFKSVRIIEHGPEFPIEAFFCRWLEYPGSMKESAVFSFGASALSLALLFGVRSTIGFGASLVKRYFRREHQTIRHRFEKFLNDEMQKMLHVKKA